MKAPTLVVVVVVVMVAVTVAVMGEIHTPGVSLQSFPRVEEHARDVSEAHGRGVWEGRQPIWDIPAGKACWR